MEKHVSAARFEHQKCAKKKAKKNGITIFFNLQLYESTDDVFYTLAV